jgi:hypothetical protein
MALRAHVKDGKIVCSSCSAVVSGDTASCPQCSEALDGDLEAMVCPYCAAILKRFSTECSQCGLRFKAVKKPVVAKGTEDEEFLKRLLEWGKKMQVAEEVESETEEDIHEKEHAKNVIQSVIGAKPTPIQKETIVQIEKTAQEKKEFEKREESILSIADPLEAALRARQASIKEAEAELVEIAREIDELNSRQDPTAVKKRERLEHKRQLLEVEKREIVNLESRLNEIDETYKKLLADHKRELDAKEANLKQRLDAFKTEMDRREDEKRRLEKKEAMLQIKEREAAATLDRLKQKERELEARELEVKRQVDALKAQRDAAGAGGALPSAAGAAGKWVVDPGEVEDVFKKSKKAREEWFAEQRRIQSEILQIRSEGVGAVAGQTAPATAEAAAPKTDTAELDAKIAALEAKIAQLEGERGKLKAAEDEAASLDEDLKKVLKVVDDLLGRLPDDVIDAFAKSEDFKSYQKVIDRYLGDG